ncbi:cytidine deaminase-like protein [Tilletiaria anomala UBC 951]|uniref:Cytidine deaminase-like protein n=1 Tax=Tilletiaria anomala (strain ATCC 24038 / CBS 436.72 / UBC 951) TaxID=1037660 RepID=A0A066WI72_TILAU|nr:cytidine deaminase-like protein [Tilletiaria anomala UBC 951]KDN50355.1 cytidine deaminase-like protein [Tilletiaria anomala UBC 951]
MLSRLYLRKDHRNLLESPPHLRKPPTLSPLFSDRSNIAHALELARTGFEDEGKGIPIGTCLVDNKTGKMLRVGWRRRVQLGSATKHGEIDLLENIDSLPARVYRKSTLYTTLSTCTMCTGACILYSIPRVVIGENDTFLGGEGILKQHDVEVVKLDMQDCKLLMKRFIEECTEVWWEDIGETGKGAAE